MEYRVILKINIAMSAQIYKFEINFVKLNYILFCNRIYNVCILIVIRFIIYFYNYFKFKIYSVNFSDHRNLKN